MQFKMQRLGTSLRDPPFIISDTRISLPSYTLPPFPELKKNALAKPSNSLTKMVGNKICET